MIKVNSIQEAWQVADEIFPTDYIKDEASSTNAGYPIYRSTATSVENYWYNYICDLGNRLEINLCAPDWSGKTINIWIAKEEERVTEANQEPEKPNDESHIEVEITAPETGETRTYKSYEAFIQDHRFFHSGGVRFVSESGYESSEDRFEKIVGMLRELNDHGTSMKIFYSGLSYEFVYYRWPQHDRYMNFIKKEG